MAKANDFKTSDKVTNSLFKGAGFNKDSGVGPALPKQQMRPAGKPAAKQDIDNEFNDRSDEEKVAKAVVAQRWDKAQDPIEFAINQRDEFPDINEMSVAKAADEVRTKSNGVPWWSAARDFNLELFRGGNAGSMFKPSPEVVSAVQQQYY